MTLGLLLAIFIASKRAEYRDLAKMSFIPGIFNINEPIMFGLPIVLNPIMMVPFIMVPIVNCAVVTSLFRWKLFHRLLMPCPGLRPDL